MAQPSVTLDLSGALTPRPPAPAVDSLRHSVAAMRAATKRGYTDSRAFINLPTDIEAAAEARTLAARHLDAELVILVGIGGQNLPVRSVEEALRGVVTPATQRPRLLYADTTDAHQTSTIRVELLRALTEKRKVLIIISSKSGTTTESVANAQLLLATLAEHDEHWARSVVAITDENSPLWHEARMHSIATLPMPSLVGGRYSVFSAAGLFPLAVLGVDIASLLAGACAMRARCLATDLKKNPAAQLALAQYLHGRAGCNITEYFVFGKDLEGVGRWYRQLLAESCGKEFDARGKRKLHAGLTPTVSVGSNDLHSVGQLALGGPYDKFTIFVEVDSIAAEERVAVPKTLPLRGLLPHLAGTDFHTILRAIGEGARRAYAEGKRPHAALRLPERSAHAIGQLLELHLIQTVYLAELLGVNAFDQPAVESYKEHTRAILMGSREHRKRA